MTSPDTTGAPAFDARTFRQVVGNLASGVTLVTTRTPEGPFGMTASSVTSLSLDPPMMLACLNTSSVTCAAVSASGAYGVNVLGEGQGHLAHQFATPSSDKFAGVQVSEGVLGVPLLTEALARIECEVVEEVRAATHTVFLGRVRRAEAAEGSPLTYFRGGFGRFEFARDDAVYQRARQQVLERRYAADTVLLLDDLAYSLDVDRPAAFYALTRLAAERRRDRDTEDGEVAAGGGGGGGGWGGGGGGGGATEGFAPKPFFLLFCPPPPSACVSPPPPRRGAPHLFFYF